MPLKQKDIVPGCLVTFNNEHVLDTRLITSKEMAAKSIGIIIKVNHNSFDVIWTDWVPAITKNIVTYYFNNFNDRVIQIYK